MSSSARSKRSSSPVFPRRSPSRMGSSYAVLFLMAWSKMVGFEVSPVTPSSSIYRASVPRSNSSRVMLSSHRLWPRDWICLVGSIASGLLQAPGRSRVSAPQSRQPSRLARKEKQVLNDRVAATSFVPWTRLCVFLSTRMHGTRSRERTRHPHIECKLRQAISRTRFWLFSCFVGFQTRLKSFKVGRRFPSISVEDMGWKSRE
jgi:hypothetical protein